MALSLVCLTLYIRLCGQYKVAGGAKAGAEAEPQGVVKVVEI